MCESATLVSTITTGSALLWQNRHTMWSDQGVALKTDKIDQHIAEAPLDEVVPARAKRMTQAQRKRQILDITLRLIEKDGIQSTTVAKIASAVGVTAPTLYRNFGSRQGLLMAAHEVVFQRSMAPIESCQSPNALERLRETARAHTVWATSKRPGHRIAVFEFAVAPRRLGLSRKVRADCLAVARRLADIVDEGKTQGVIRQDVDSIETAWRVLGCNWLESVALTMGVHDPVIKDASLASLDSILDEIAVRPQE
jgi:AcrR family transcriptional regulator